jgi:myo-inositol-1-phosphate synthase
MDLSQAIEQANAFVFPGFLTDDDSLTQERSKNEEAIKVLTDAWKAAPLGREPFSFDLVRGLADRNRDICDRYGIERLRNTNGLNLRTPTLSTAWQHSSTAPTRRSRASLVPRPPT